MMRNIRVKELVLFRFRGSGKPLSFADVVYVPGLTKSLISVSALEDKGYQVKFRDHRVYIKPKGLDRSLDRVIGIRSKKAYRHTLSLQRL